MKRIDSINARPNVNGTGKTGFHDNADLSGQDATYLTPSWLNQVQEELCNLLEMNGIALNSGVRDQLYQLLATNDDINALAAYTQFKLDQEQTWRENADNDLQRRINNEQTWRENADNDLQRRINNEQTARINAINQEQAWRENADADLENRKFDKAGGTVDGDLTVTQKITTKQLFVQHKNGLDMRLEVANYGFLGLSKRIEFVTGANNYTFDKNIYAPNINVHRGWYDLTASRALNTPYTNDTNSDIDIIINFQDNQGNSPLAVIVGGTTLIDVSDFGAGGTHPVTFTVPSGYGYTVNTAANGVNTIRRWSERREV